MLLNCLHFSKRKFIKRAFKVEKVFKITNYRFCQFFSEKILKINSYLHITALVQNVEVY